MIGGYVYLLGENGDNCMHKIGVTCGDINKRIKQLQTGNGNGIFLVDAFYSTKPYKLEVMLHNKWQTERMEGEWFLLGPEETKNFKQDCMFFENIINTLKDNPFF